MTYSGVSPSAGRDASLGRGDYPVAARYYHLMQRRRFLARMGAAVGGIGAVVGTEMNGVVGGAQRRGPYREPVVTSPAIRRWTLEEKRTDRTVIRAGGRSFGDAYTSTLIYKDARLASGLDRYVRGNFEGIVGAFMATRVTFDSPLSILAQPSLVTGIAKERFERNLRRLGFSDIRERPPSERETTAEQAVAEYEADYDASEYIERPNSPAYRLPSVTPDGRVKTILYLEVLKPGETLLFTAGIRPTDELLRVVFDRDGDAYRAELLRLMHDVK
ncbi:hypothetical protein ZOD2009_17503 [Haladaptatus paucihalophilus DX253]|uniref:Uncharacterized protein n=2 Tax=Haladaptatus paucihalophilus DX253 TaxID=797209 RepID=E7QXG2_HALPU|nr:hypothetical protein [Haladaptatus paucihalophilus]EFW90965.1 hypothetical protein ZOD2009_17503 [Haladaptatus paucihalophilus DX253]